jgi:protein involved in polysaccharide export with SLBB domain
MRHAANFALAGLISLFVLMGVAPGRDAPATKPSSESSLPDRAIDTWDLVRVTIPGLHDPITPTILLKRIDQNGDLWLPVVGAINVRAKQPADVAQAIAQLYHDRELLDRADVKVQIVEAARDAKVKPGAVDKGDLLEVRMWDLAGPNKESREVLKVDADGKISLPKLGKIEVAGLTDGPIEQAITKAYREAGLIANTPVSVRKIDEWEAAAGK